MSDDAQTPEGAAHAPVTPPGAGNEGTAPDAASGPGPDPAAPRLTKDPADRRPGEGTGGGLWPPPVNESPDASDGATQVAVPDAVPDAAPTAWPAPSVPEADHQTVTSIPTLGDRPAPPVSTPPPAQPWAAPSATPADASGADPFALPDPTLSAPNGPANPFAPPTSPPPRSASAYGPGGHPVPPPPIAPDGPGQVPYGYPGHPGPPGAHGHPGVHGFPAHAPGYGGGPQAQGYYSWPGMGPVPPRNGMGTAGLVLGIIAAVGFCMWPLAILAGVLGVIFGVVGRARARKGEATNSGQALAGIICGASGLLLGLGLGILLIANA